MAIVLENCTNEEQHSVVRFSWTEGLTAKDIHEEISSLRWKVFVT
jgi:hypothetical protein